MPLVIADRVRETTTTTGTGTLTLAGPYSGFQAFSVIGNGNTTYYAIIDAQAGAWEVGIGAYASVGNTLSRATVLASSNAGALVNLAAGTKDVILTQPAGRSVLVQEAGSGLITGVAAFTANGIPYANATNTLTTSSGLTYNGTALDVAALDVTNVRALDGTASFSIANTTGVMSIDDTKFTLQDNTDNTKKAVFEASGITTATTRTYTLPNATGTIPLLNLSQTFTAAQTFTGSVTMSSATGTYNISSGGTTGTVTIGGVSGTGTLTLGHSTVSQTTNIQAGATASGSTKTINFGTEGLSGSTTNISVGSSVPGAVTNFAVQGVTVGRGGGALSGNTVVGEFALASNTAGGGNDAFGIQTLNSNTTGSENTAFGGSSLFSNTTGSENTACGGAALATNQTGVRNTAVGDSALLFATGSNNTVIGRNAGSQITTGDSNVVIGSYTGQFEPIGQTGSNWIVLSDGAGTVRQSIDPSGNTQFTTNAVVVYAPAPASFSAAATLTNADIQTQLIVTTGTTFTLTMPLGSDLDNLISWVTNDIGYDFSVINTASSTITMAANTGVTTVGRLTVLTNISGRFRIRRTAASTYIMYRIG